MKFFRNLIKRRLLMLLLVLCVVSSAIVGMAYGKYLSDLEDNAEVDIIGQGVLNLVVSGPTNGAAGSYTVSNLDPANMPCYVRLAVTVNWQDGDGNVWITPSAIENTHYTIGAAAWQKEGDYYYYKGMLEKGESCGFTVTAVGTPPSGYTLRVQILAEGIQCVPTSAAGTAWGYTYADGAWSSVGTP